MKDVLKYYQKKKLFHLPERDTFGVETMITAIFVSSTNLKLSNMFIYLD